MINKVNYEQNTTSVKQTQLRNMKAYPGYGMDFEALLRERLNKTPAKEVQFSKHAKERVEQRGIEVTPTLMDSLNEAVNKAREKGAKDVVIIGPNEAFIVNVPNNVVVTTMSGTELKDNIFTNIDSAVIL